MEAFIHGTNTSDIRFVAAVTAMGIHVEDADASMAVRSPGGTVRNWFMSEVSDCEKWKLSTLQAWWRDRNFHESNPSHPFARVKAAMASGKAFSEAFRTHRGVAFVRRGCALIAVVVEEPQRIHKPRTFEYKASDDFHKVSAFLAMGFECWEIASAGNRRLFAIPSRSITGESRDKFEVAWEDASFHKANPQSDFAYVKAALWNHVFLIGLIKNDKPLVNITKGESFAYLHPDCSAETEREIMARFQQ